MNPLLIARNLREEYLRLLKTTFRPRQHELREHFDAEIERDGFLTREPFIALAQPFKQSSALTQLLPETQKRFAPITETPYQHQADACLRILARKPTVVATGTGSGKTEAFLMPIVDHCLRVHKPGVHSVKAILIYPMNALANDQNNRIRERLAGTNVSFGRYTRETRVWGSRPAETPENERVLRSEFRSAPPDLLLTNYMMLEYMLMRGDGREIFRNHEIQFIVLDEVHTYHGLLGTDVACLLRRLREALRKANPNIEALFVGTSATLQAGEDGDPRLGVADFFTRLTGQPTPPESVITETTNPPLLPSGTVLPAPPSIAEEEIASFNANDGSQLQLMVSKLSGVAVNRDNLTAVWSKMGLPYLLMNWLRQPRSEEAIIDELSHRPERQGVARDSLRREIEAALMVGPFIDSSSPVRLRPRVHRFLRGLARFWRCTNPVCGKLVGEGVDECDACKSRTLPLALCRTCGWDFYMAQIGKDDVLQPWLGRRSDKSTVFLFDPPNVKVEVDEEFDPAGEDDEELSGEGEGEVDDESDEGGDAEKYLDPQSLRIVDPGMMGGDYQLRPVNVLHGRGTRCPICRSRYGAQDVLTPVSLGNSSALTHVARVLMRDLPEENRKLLVFCDSRQDAAHQSRFISASEDRVRVRRATYQALKTQTEPHDLDWLVDVIYEQYIEEGVFKRSKKKDQQKRDKSVIVGALINEFAIAPRVRAGLERLGLVKVRYAALAEELASSTFRTLCLSHNLDPDLAARSVSVLLDEFRHRMALSHEILTQRMSPGDKLARDYQLTINRQVGIPVGFLPPEQKSITSKGYKLVSTWNAKGTQTAAQRIWKQFHDVHATASSLDDVLRWLQERQYLTWQTIGSKDDQSAGWQVSIDVIEFEAAKSFLHCTICDKIASNEEPGQLCTRFGCHGKMATWEGPIAQGNLNALMVVEKYAPSLFPAEHSAAVADDKREEYERGFMDGSPPRPNLLACTPTLEMGVNIGDLEAVAMRNIPPSPANYAQRSGRTGRVSRMGITAGFSRNTPHDGYFFDHPEQIIAGAIPPPKFNLKNLEAISRHIHSLVLELAELDFPASLERFLSEKGDLIEGQISDLLNRLKSAAPMAASTALRLWNDVSDVTPEFVQTVVTDFPEQIRAALVERGQLLAHAAEEVRKLGEKIKLSAKEEQAQQGFRQLAIRLREDNKYSYLPRVLAEAGLLPGYSFPGDPGSVSLGYAPEPIFGGRLQAQREFAPGQIVYARGTRWSVSGIALHRPGSTASGGHHTFDFTLCGSCGLANAPALDFCARCSHPIGDSSGSGLTTFTAWDAGAFQAWEAEVAAESEEERAIQSFDVRPHPQRNVVGRKFQLGSWQLELREQEDIWFINHGLKDIQKMAEERAKSPGFPLCPVCGEYFKPNDLVPRKVKRKKDEEGEKDSRSRIDSHAKRCIGQIKKEPGFSLGHKLRADTLRLNIPNIAAHGDEAVRWAWSMVYAIIQGAVRLFEIDPEDIEAYVLTKFTKDEEERTHQEVLDILWIDRIVGGSGVLNRLAEHFPQVAQSALQHLDGHDCPNSCYRCLRSYRNQWYHKLLDWRMVVPHLRGISGETVAYVADIQPETSTVEGPEWEEARREGCESPQELRLLKAIRNDGNLPEPTKQHVVWDENKFLTRADFAYLDCEPRILIYVDGLAWHSDVRQRAHDNCITNRLQMLGYRVLRFLGTETHRTPKSCVGQIREARDVKASTGTLSEGIRYALLEFIEQQIADDQSVAVCNKLLNEVTRRRELSLPDLLKLASDNSWDGCLVHAIAEKLCYHKSGVWQRRFRRTIGGASMEMSISEICDGLRMSLATSEGIPEWTQQVRVYWSLK
jgi:ATP-dependent helicase YprA (DUF1998 family)